MLDTIVIGGGASGLATAVMLKKAEPTYKIAVFEQLERVGKKISTTGNGRCNITNKMLLPKNFHSSSPQMVTNVIGGFGFEQTVEFFSSIGVEITTEGNKAFPRSFQASSVVDALRFACEELGIELITSAKINSVNKFKNGFSVCGLTDGVSDKKYSARTVLIATGGLAGGSKLGCDGDGYRFLKSFGHTVLPQTPVISQVKTDNAITKSLKGIKVNASVTVSDETKSCSDFGEVLFCDYGLSGPPILQLSRYCKPKSIIELDLFPELDSVSLFELLQRRKQIFAKQPLTEFFAGLLHKRIGQAVLKGADLTLSSPCSSLTQKDLHRVCVILKAFSFKATGNTGFINAQATSGGASLTEFYDNLMSKKVSGLFAAGEVLDVDGDCGGFNLQWAWSSAKAASQGIRDFLGGKND